MDVVARLQEFDPDLLLPDDFFILMYGIRRSGKSVMLKYMLSELDNKLQDHEVYLFSGTAEVNPEQYDYVPPKARFPNIAELEVELSQIVGKQKQKIKEFHEGRGDEPSSILIIFDDCVSENSMRHSPSLNALAISGRHMKISVVILSQAVTGSASVPPVVRIQCDCIIVVAQPRSETERKLISEQYLTAEQSFAGKQKGLSVLAAATSVQYRALVILTTDSSARRYTEYLYTYGPVDENVEVQLGTQEQWAESEGNPAAKEKKPVKKKAKTEQKNNSTLPNPFNWTPPLPTDNTGEYLNGLSDNLGASNRRGRRRR